MKNNDTNKALKRIFYDPKVDFTDVPTLYHQAREKKIPASYQQVMDWYYDQPINQIYKNPTKVRTYNRIYSHHNQVGELQADLMDVSNFSKQNGGIKYLLNVIDIYSRYAWFYPIKSKKPSEIAPHIEQVFKSIPKDNYKALCVDLGNEFKGQVNTILEQNNVKRFYSNPKDGKNKMAMIERFNYTVWKKLKKYMNAYNTLSYKNVLPDLISNYNNTRHSTIKKKPIDVFKGLQYPAEQGLGLTSNDLIRKFSVGDMVRYQKKRKVFDKRGFKPTFSVKIYQIVGIRNNKYELNNGRSYYEEELVKATTEPLHLESSYRLMKLNKKENKAERQLREEFKKPVEEIHKQIVQGKRTRKPNPKYLET
jgi:hypothetical protein